MSMKQHNYRPYLAVGIGGVIGTLLRYLIATSFVFITFPVGTIVANLLGCFLLAYLTFHPKIKSSLSPDTFTALATGLLGSFTTFSTFIMDGYVLTTENNMLFWGYFGIQIVGGLLCCLLGAKVATLRELET